MAAQQAGAAGLGAQVLALTGETPLSRGRGSLWGLWDTAAELDKVTQAEPQTHSAATGPLPFSRSSWGATLGPPHSMGRADLFSLPSCPESSQPGSLCLLTPFQRCSLHTVS